VALIDRADADQPADHRLDALHLLPEIPGEILEAARMDGAGLREEILYVLTPMADPGHRVDDPSELHPGLERGVLDAEPDGGRTPRR
jgi:hypothetical protein